MTKRPSVATVIRRPSALFKRRRWNRGFPRPFNGRGLFVLKDLDMNGKAISIGILGMGTVGTGVAWALNNGSC